MLFSARQAADACAPGSGIAGEYTTTLCSDDTELDDLSSVVYRLLSFVRAKKKKKDCLRCAALRCG